MINGSQGASSFDFPFSRKNQSPSSSLVPTKPSPEPKSVSSSLLPPTSKTFVYPFPKHQIDRLSSFAKNVHSKPPVTFSIFSGEPGGEPPLLLDGKPSAGRHGVLPARHFHLPPFCLKRSATGSSTRAESESGQANSTIRTRCQAIEEGDPVTYAVLVRFQATKEGRRRRPLE